MGGVCDWSRKDKAFCLFSWTIPVNLRKYNISQKNVQFRRKNCNTDICQYFLSEVFLISLI